MERWFAIYTKPRHEKKVDAELQEMGYESYCPVQKTLKQWSDRKKWVIEPLFKSYCFVRVQPEKYLLPLKAYGALRYVYYNGKPAIVRDSEMDKIKMICASEYPVEIVEKDFRKGQKIIISSGPLEGIEGECIECEGKHKLLIRIDSVNHAMLVSVPKVLVEAC